MMSIPVSEYMCRSAADDATDGKALIATSASHQDEFHSPAGSEN